MRQTLAPRRVSEKWSPSFTQLTYNRQIEMTETNSEALPYLKAFVDNHKDPAARLEAAEWLCDNNYAMTTAITALSELSFEDDQRVAFKALAKLATVDSNQALDALRGIFKWGPTKDVRSRAAKFLKRRLLEELGNQPLGLPPASPEALSLPVTDSPTLPNIFPRLPASDALSTSYLPPEGVGLLDVADKVRIAEAKNEVAEAAPARFGFPTVSKAKANMRAMPEKAASGGALSRLQTRLVEALYALPLLPKLLGNRQVQTWWLPLLVLAFTGAAELFITPAATFTNPLLAMGLHVIVMFVLLYNVLHTTEPIKRRLNTVLLLIPLTRTLSLGVPLVELPQIYSYVALSLPLFIAIMLIIWQESWSREELGFTFNHLPLQIMTALSGLGLGWLQYQLLQPEPLVSELTWQTTLLPAIVLMVSTGYLEELMFRGLLQNAAMPILGHWASLFFVSALFAVLNISLLSLPSILLIFGIGLIFGLVVAHSRSIVGVTLAHGIMNITLFMMWPYWLPL